MSSNLFRLRASELELLLLLNDAADDDSVGRTIDELTDRQRILAEDLESAGLLRFDIGWRGIGWYRLTALGRELVRSVKRSPPERRPDGRHSDSGRDQDDLGRTGPAGGSGDRRMAGEAVAIRSESAHVARMANPQDGFQTDRTLSLWRDGRITLDVAMDRIGATTPDELLFVATSDHVSPMNLAAVAKLSFEG